MEVNNINKIIQGNCLDKLKELPDSSVDAIVTDPPYELGFMGKGWDSTGIANNVDMWKECLRVLKPGGHLLSFGGTRTYHRMAVAIEDAGFDIRDQIAWCYGQGFPKSLNISLQIKKKYNIGLCTCNVFEPMIELGYENSNNKRDNISNGDNDGLGSGEQIRSKGNDNNEVAEQIKDTHISSNSTIRKESRMCELSEDHNQKEQGLEKVSESILQSGVCKPISENERLGNTTIRTGVEEVKTTSAGEGQGLSDMQNKTTNGITSSSPDSVQNGGQELNGEPSGSLSELPQQDREDNRKRIEQVKNDCGTEEWNNLSRFICSKCYCLKKDIGGTALKPSIEPICMARKPLSEKTVVENVLKWGTGGINIDGCRVKSDDWDEKTVMGKYTGNNENNDSVTNNFGVKEIKCTSPESTLLGRFPANLIHDNSEEVRECFPETKSGNGKSGINLINRHKNTSGAVNINCGESNNAVHFGDSGNASRFFKSIIYTAKASKSERNRGCEGLEEKAKVFNGQSNIPSKDMKDVEKRFTTLPKANNHPTVKPIALMEYLINMVTKEGQTVLDPFAGSGTTLIAAKKLGRKYIGIELEPEYVKIAEARLRGVTSSMF